MCPYDLTSNEDRTLELIRMTLTVKYQQRKTSVRASTVSSAVTYAMSSPERHPSDAEVGVTVEKVN